MALTVTVLGCDGTYAGPGGACSGYLVQGGGVAVWLDTGPGTLANLQRHVPLDEVDAVVVSHVHPDHWVELPVFRNAVRYGLDRTSVPVYAPAEVREQADRLASEGTEDTFAWTVVGDGDHVGIGGLALRFSRTDHPGETLAVRVDGEDGRSLAYSADTAAGWSFTALGEGIDVAFCDATLPVHLEGTAPHMSARQAGAAAAEAGVGRLVLTHLWPGTDRDRHRADAEAAFGGPVEVAELHRRYEA